MIQKVPTRNFKWVDEDTVKDMNKDMAKTVVDIAKLDPEADTGYIFKIDAYVPSKEHDKYVLNKSLIATLIYIRFNHY